MYFIIKYNLCYIGPATKQQFTQVVAGLSRKNHGHEIRRKKSKREMVLEQSRRLDPELLPEHAAHDTVGKVQLVETGDIVFL